MSEGPASASPASLRVLSGLFRFLGNATRSTVDGLLWPIERRIPRDWLALRLDQGLGESPPLPPWNVWTRRRSPALWPTVKLLEVAATDAAVRGVLLRVGRAEIGWAQLATLVRCVERLRACGKHTVVYTDGTGNAGAWIGASAEHFWVAPQGRVDLLGIKAESNFLRGVLDRWGIVPEVMSAGAFKSVGEILTRDGMSEPAREALEAVIESLYRSLVDGLSAARRVDSQAAQRWIDEGPYLAREAQAIGLVDACLYGDEVPERLGALDDPSPESGSVTPLGPAQYRRLARRRFRWDQVMQPPRRIAILPITGMLRPGAGSPRGVVGVIRRLASQDSFAGVVLRIDTPGGDALASDLIWRAVRKLAEEKPVVASLGNTAASGGYYIAMAANEIVAEPTTLTGSIGVAALAALDLEGLLESLGVRQESVQRGRHAGIFDLHHRRTSEERALLQRQVDTLYMEFVRKAAEGRGLPEEELEAVARGRVWTGAQALEHRLVDSLGGIEEAVASVRVLAGLGVGEGEVVLIPSVERALPRLLSPSPIDAELTAGPASLLELAASGACLLCPIRVPLR